MTRLALAGGAPIPQRPMNPCCHGGLVALLLTASFASPAASLCKPAERVVFACTAKPKQVALCASGDLRRPEGRLVYRFGRDAARVELEHGADKPPREAGYRYDYSPWAKGASSLLAFDRGGYLYVLEHASGAFGVDGGDNVAQLRVMRGETVLTIIRCHEPSTVDRLYEELQALQLPQP